jgi:hypothetical protein
MINIQAQFVYIKYNIPPYLFCKRYIVYWFFPFSLSLLQHD